MSKKRGQVAIFLVLALVLLIIGSFYFFFQQATEEEIDLSDPQAASAKNFIDACVTQVSDDAFRLIGINGGYATFPDEINRDSRTYLQTGPLSEIKNPYWWFDGKSNIPSEEFIINQAEGYVKKKLKECITNLNSLNQFEVRELEEMDVTVELNRDDVTVTLDYPIELIYGINRTKVTLSEFQQTLPIRFKEVYEYAVSIMNAENEDFFLEKKTIDLITLDPAIPTTDIEATCEQKIWYLPEVEAKLKRLLSTNLPYINIVGSEFNTEAYVPNPYGEDIYAESYFNSNYRWDVGEKRYEDMKATVSYDPSWPMLLNARPSRNGILTSKAQQGLDLLQFLCIHIWHFSYDVVYPVKVSIVDSSGIEPYQFNFAFKVSIDHNQPKRENFLFQIRQDPDFGNSEEFCNDRVHAISIFTKSNETDEPDITDVNLTYTCGIFTCDIGQTEWLGFGAAAGLTTEFPFCNNGIVRAKKEGYLDSQLFVQTEQPGFYEMHLTPIREFTEFDVVKHNIETTILAEPLDEDDKVSIIIKSQTSDFESFVVFPTQGALPLTLINDDHTYDVTMFLTNGDEIAGGYEGEWHVSKSEIEEADLIKFHVLENANSDDTFLFIQGLPSYSKDISEPELI